MTDGTGLYERNQKALSKMSFLRFFPLAVTGGEGAWPGSYGGNWVMTV